MSISKSSWTISIVCVRLWIDTCFTENSFLRGRQLCYGSSYRLVTCSCVVRNIEKLMDEPGSSLGYISMIYWSAGPVFYISMKNILSNELVAKDQSLSRLNESLKQRARLSRELSYEYEAGWRSRNKKAKRNKEREREKKTVKEEENAGKWQTDTTNATTHPGICSLRITSRRTIGKDPTRKSIYRTMELGLLA